MVGVEVAAPRENLLHFALISGAWGCKQLSDRPVSVQSSSRDRFNLTKISFLFLSKGRRVKKTGATFTFLGVLSVTQLAACAEVAVYAVYKGVSSVSASSDEKNKAADVNKSAIESIAAANQSAEHEAVIQSAAEN